MGRVVLLAVLLAAALAGCGGGGSSTATTPTATTTTTTPTATTTTPAQGAGLRVDLHAPARPPRAGHGWPVRISAETSAGRPVDGTVSYAFVFGGAVVARRPGGHMSGGTYRDSLKFPARAVGLPITLRVVVKGDGRTGTTERPVKVRPA